MADVTGSSDDERPDDCPELEDGLTFRYRQIVLRARNAALLKERADAVSSDSTPFAPLGQVLSELGAPPSGAAAQSRSAASVAAEAGRAHGLDVLALQAMIDELQQRNSDPEQTPTPSPAHPAAFVFSPSSLLLSDSQRQQLAATLREQGDSWSYDV
eukprot:gnl/Spiro4/6139_TR3156_c1_g1_i1.p1 gnl/Spiro4/6139_TR3156_c1_g1~~gnl/Spiro4/6139_TR3156_c1_g1_i1.p1  ORF type:complete len:170 (+),score=41.22 gnl/Spiro4/6139_TR3156_c1_g1_i1:40-510(+)